MLLVATPLEELGISHAFTTRLGGMSAAPFVSLNLGRGVGDDPVAVQTNRARAAAAVGRRLDDHVEASQVHGAFTAIVGAADRGGKIDGADGLASNDPKTLLAVHCADCVPILLADPVRRAVAAVHTGWRGTAAGAAASGVRAMHEAFGSRPADLRAAIGPAIGPCCYLVDAPVLERFGASPGRDDVFAAAAPGQWRLDLWEANRRQLEDAGVPAGAVVTARLCTSDHPELFFSHRRDGRSGRMAALIALP